MMAKKKEPELDEQLIVLSAMLEKAAEELKRLAEEVAEKDHGK